MGENRLFNGFAFDGATGETTVKRDARVDAVTRLTPETLARRLSSAFGEKVEPERVAEIARDGGLLDDEKKIVFLDYLAFLIRNT